MKPFKFVVFLVLLFMPILTSLFAGNNQKQIMKTIYQLYEQEHYKKALVHIEEALKNHPSANELIQLKYNILLKFKKYKEALDFINGEIQRSGETEELLSAKYNILFLQGRLSDALAVAMKKYNNSKIKSPWDCMNIMHVHLRMGNKIDALDWLQEAVRRGFISYRILDDKKYHLLEKEKRFYAIIDNIKMSIGLGYPAKNFTTTLISGNKITLKHLRGKVVIIYFWASWCKPCRKEIPFLDQFFKKYKNKGLELISISLDSNIEKMMDYCNQQNIQWKHACSGNAWKDETVVKYGVSSLPSLWVIDRKGVLRSFDVKGKELEYVIQTLLAE